MAEYWPPGVSRQDFDQAIAEIRKIVGENMVYTDPAGELQGYLDHMSAVPPESRMPSAAIAPATPTRRFRGTRMRWGKSCEGRDFKNDETANDANDGLLCKPREWK